MNRIGAGTGLFTRALLGHSEWRSDVKELKAVEPSSGMREVFCNTVQDPRTSISDGTFESTGVEDGWADAIIIAQVAETNVPRRIIDLLIRPSIGAPTMIVPQ